MSYPRTEIPAADLALPADLISYVTDLLDLVEASKPSQVYLDESIDLLKLVLTQLNRWTPKDER